MRDHWRSVPGCIASWPSPLLAGKASKRNIKRRGSRDTSSRGSNGGVGPASRPRRRPSHDAVDARGRHSHPPPHDQPPNHGHGSNNNPVRAVLAHAIHAAEPRDAPPPPQPQPRPQQQQEPSARRRAMARRDSGRDDVMVSSRSSHSRGSGAAASRDAARRAVAQAPPPAAPAAPHGPPAQAGTQARLLARQRDAERAYLGAGSSAKPASRGSSRRGSAASSRAGSAEGGTRRRSSRDAGAISSRRSSQPGAGASAVPDAVVRGVPAVVPASFPSRSHRLNPVVGEAKAALAYQPDSMFEQAPPSHREQYPAGSPIGVGGGGVGTALDLFDTSVRSVCEWQRLWLVLLFLLMMMMMIPPA